MQKKLLLAFHTSMMHHLFALYIQMNKAPVRRISTECLLKYKEFIGPDLLHSSIHEHQLD